MSLLVKKKNKVSAPTEPLAPHLFATLGWGAKKFSKSLAPLPTWSKLPIDAYHATSVMDGKVGAREGVCTRDALQIEKKQYQVIGY